MAKLTAAKRNALSSKTFAEPAKRAYLLTDENHARNALARVSQFGTAHEKAVVRKAVHERFPGIKVSD